VSGAPRLFKLVAAGNDFVVVDAREHPGLEWSAEEARRACRRRRGIGADGVVTLGPPTGATGATARFHLRNSDGSRAAFSGNGARCAARLLSHLGAAPEGDVTFETEGGLVAARLIAHDVEVDVAPPRDARLDLTLPDGSIGDHAIVGVPYLAVAVPDVDALDLASVAPPLRRWNALPEGANVAFYETPAAPFIHPVRMRSYERGVEGETLSSGTGCAMVATALALRHPADGERTVHLETRSRAPLSVRVTMRGGEVTALALRGDALLVGEIHAGPDLLLPDP